MIANYYHYRIGPVIESPANLFGVIVCGRSVTENTFKARDIIGNRRESREASISPTPLSIDPGLLSPAGKSAIKWDSIYDAADRMRGNAALRLQKLILDIDTQGHPGPQDWPSTLSKGELESLLGSELASEMTSAPNTGFFIASQYDSNAGTRLEPLAVVAANSLDEAGTLYAATVTEIRKQAILIEPCWDVVMS